jgi:hypothetical protein
VSQFVEECRREWKRLGVPDPAAEEMASDLTADLAEAEAEGASAEHVLGTGAFDPRSFAAAWAAERGLVQAPPTDDHGPERRSRVPAVFAATAIIATLGLVLVLVANRMSTTQVESASPVPAPNAPPARTFAMDIHGDGYHHMIGFIVLLIAVVVVISATLYWATWVSPSRWSPRRRSSIADGSH